MLVGANSMSTTIHFTVEQYDRMIQAGVFPENGERFELIRGEIRKMVPPSPEHDDLIDVVAQWSFDSVNRAEVRVRVQTSLGLPSLDSVPLPDLSWVRQRSYRHRRPIPEDVLLVIDVSASTLAYDRGEKAELYSQAGVADYWIVNERDHTVEVHRDPGPDRYRTLRTYSGDEEVRPLAVPKAVLRPAILWPVE
jgi:Uma2 family endonuclease